MSPISQSQSGSKNRRIPKYCRQNCKGRQDRAYVRLQGKTFMLGNYDSDRSRQKYAELIGRGFGPMRDYLEIPKPSTDLTVAELMAAYLDHINTHYGEKSPIWYHIRLFMR